MRVELFLSLSLALTLVWMQFYASVRQTYNGLAEYKTEIATLKKQLEHQEVEALVQADHFLEFRQHVATLMPDVVREKGMGEEGYPFRSLASTLTKGESFEIRKTLAKTLFEKGKDYFRKKEYAKANQAFKQLIDKYGFSPDVVESYFLMAEGYYQSDSPEEATRVIQQMVEIFPNHELTGLAMVRLGRIFETQSRVEEAVDIYKTVIRSFPQRDVASQAKSSLRGLSL